ncbi:hypothetical protein VKS41_005449 [Umbelopsis sp. WA50703]
MGNVPSSSSARSKSLPVSQASNDSSSTADQGRASLPNSNIMHYAKKRLRSLTPTRSTSTPSFFSSISLDKDSQQSSISEEFVESPTIHPAVRKTSALHGSVVSIQGRKFHNHQHSKYSLPCDEEEQDRMMALHFLLKHMFRSNYSAPVTELLSTKKSDGSRARVLDIGCGPGHWSLEMASEFPDARFYGVDISAIYPTDIKPANTFFIQDNILTTEILDQESFDYIFVRHVYGCFSVFEWDLLMKVIMRLLKPGGFVEFREVDPTVKHPGPVTADIINTQFTMAMRTTRSIDPLLACNLLNLFKHSELVDIHHQVMPIGAGWGECGDIVQTNLDNALKAYGTWLSDAIGLLPEEYVSRCEAIFKEGPKYHSYIEWHMIWARKPIDQNTMVDEAEWEGMKEFLYGYTD